MNFETPENSTMSSNLRRISARAHAEDRAVQKNVLAAGQLGMKSGADLEQRADAAEQFALACRRPRDARQDLQQRALAGAVAADDADHFAAADLEIDAVERPDVRLPASPARGRTDADSAR